MPPVEQLRSSLQRIHQVKDPSLKKMLLEGLKEHLRELESAQREECLHNSEK